MISGDALFVLNLGLDAFYAVTWLDFKSDSFSGEGLHEDLHSTAESEDQVQSGLLLDVIVREGSTVVELLSTEDYTLLINGDTFLVLNLSLNALNGVGSFNFKSHSLASEGSDEDLHPTAESQDEVES